MSYRLVRMNPIVAFFIPIILGGLVLGLFLWLDRPNTK